MRIVVAMSGGVDSSVAAALLVDQGHDVVGVSMQLYDQSHGERTFGSCCTIDDLHDARRVATALEMPHYILNFERQFDTHVIGNFVREYTAGRTPLPCAHCNSDLKFATLLDRARGFGADVLATGHYAQVVRDEASGRFLLTRALDPAKDQSYFLFSLTQAQLGSAVFPVGNRSKQAVRDYARARNLPVADKPDSQEICFVPDQDYASFIDAHAPEAASASGSIVTEDGRTIGQHKGVHRFTVGQRKGLGVSSSIPLYVLELQPERQQVVVGPRSALDRAELTASHVNWIVAEPTGPLRIEAQIRHRHRPAAGTVEPMDHHGDRLRASVRFDEPQPAITPGQAVVFYQGDVVLGGGWID